MKRLDPENLEEELGGRHPLPGGKYRAILHKLTDLLIDISAHLDIGKRHYNALFEK